MKVADYSDPVTVAQLDVALHAGAFEAVLHYLAGTVGWVRRIEAPAVVAGIRAKGWPQMGIDIPFSPANVNGAATAARVAQVYGFGRGFRLWLDIEPSRWVLDKAGWVAAANRWCDDVRAAGFSPGPYGVDETVAACANHADAIWRAVPGVCDPAAPGLPGLELNTAFFAGRRMIQCGAGVWGGIEFDVNYSQLAIGGGPMSWAATASDGDLVELFHLMQSDIFGAIDPNGQQDFVNTVRAGVAPNAIGDGWRASAQAQAYQAARQRLVADDAELVHLQAAGTSGVDPAALQAALAQWSADQKAVLDALVKEQADMATASTNPAL